MSDIKFVILGFKHRGLWLASELAKRKFDVTWMNILNSQVSSTDFPWQLGSRIAFESAPKSVQEFIQNNYKSKNQSSLQILTPRGPLEFNSEFTERSLKYYFSSSKELLQTYFEALHKKSKSLISALEQKLIKLPLAERWLLEWNTSLPLSIDGGFKKFVHSDLLNPIDVKSDYVLFDGEIVTSINKAIEIAEKSGVKIIQDAKILDIGLEGSKISGVEIEDIKGFVPCDQLVLSCPASYIQDTWEHVAQKIDGITINAAPPKVVWYKFSFSMKPQTKPVGLFDFSSFVMDPMMPLEGSNFGLIEWKVDELDIWCRIAFEEARKQSILEITLEKVKKNLSSLLSSFEENLISTKKLDPEISGVKNRYVFDLGQKILKGLYKKNLWFAGPETDDGHDLVSSLLTEKNILDDVLKKFLKEKNGDRKIHASPHGEAVVN